PPVPADEQHDGRADPSRYREREQRLDHPREQQSHEAEGVDPSRVAEPLRVERGVHGTIAVAHAGVSIPSPPDTSRWSTGTRYARTPSITLTRAGTRRTLLDDLANEVRLGGFAAGGMNPLRDDRWLLGGGGWDNAASTP